jgi:hypothetical protein
MKKSLKLMNSKWWLHGIDVFVCIFSQYKAPPRGADFSLLLKEGEGQYIHIEFIREVVLRKASV